MSNQDYAIGEWYTGHRRIEGDELARYEARAAAREIVTDEPIGPGAPTTLTVVRPTRDEVLAEMKQQDARRIEASRYATCPGCGVTFLPDRRGQRYHDVSCRSRAARQRAKERATA